ncbi:hypothetical protein EDB80DRAFT_4267 [Ilyonectria destructans]|nr:hypothetical protein EDB80DRAFT_4267 [Ilyonectria destructans]
MDIGVSALVAALVWAIGGRRPAPLNQVQNVLPPSIQQTRDRKSSKSQTHQRGRLEKSQWFGKRRNALSFSELNRLGAELAWGGDIISGAFARPGKDPTLTGKRGNDPDMGLLSKCNKG